MGREGYERSIQARTDLFEFEGEITVKDSEQLADRIEERLEYQFSPEVVADVLEDHLNETLIEILISEQSD